MNKVIQRLLIFFIGLPIIIGIVATSAYHHFLLHIVIVLCSVFGSKELYDLFSIKYKQFSRYFVISISTIPSVVAWICSYFGLEFHYLEFSLLACFLLILAVEVFSAKNFEHSLDRILTASFSVLYCGYLITYVSRLTVYPHSTNLIITFLSMIFICDSFAWFFGILFGKNNRGLVKVSPNKSIAGFVGGYIGAIGAAFLSRFLWPEIYFGSPLKIVFMGIAIATVGIVGDLVESVIKRSVGAKDSGSIVPGRGGLLDSIDSVLFASPIFYMFVYLFFK